MKTLSLALMSVLYVIAGLNHFRSPKTYLKIMPPYMPAPDLLVFVSGVAEVALGFALWVPALRPWAAWGIIALLVAVFPANIFMFQQGGKSFGLPDWVLLLRLPLQGLLILWAYHHTSD